MDSSNPLAVGKKDGWLSFARPGSAPIGEGKKGEFRDWTRVTPRSNVRACAMHSYPVATKKISRAKINLPYENRCHGKKN